MEIFKRNTYNPLADISVLYSWEFIVIYLILIGLGVTAFMLLRKKTDEASDL